MLGFLQFIIEKAEVKKRSDPNKKEREHLEHLQSEIERVKKHTGKDQVKIEHNGKIYHITHAEKVPGVPKADFKLNDRDENHVYLSHKDFKESGKQDPAKSYNQLGGVSKYKDHPVIKRFAKRIKERFGGSAVGKGTIAMTLRNKNKEESDLVRKALFGHDHGENKHGVNAVHSLVQGKMSLHSHPKHKGVYVLHAHHIMHHDQPLSTDYQVFARTAKSGSSKRNDLGLKNTRVGIGMVGGRKVTHNIKAFIKK